MEHCDLKVYSPILMLGMLGHFSRDAFEVNLDLFPGPTATAALSARMMNDSFQVH